MLLSSEMLPATSRPPFGHSTVMCAGDEGGIKRSDDEAVASLCGDGEQDMSGGNNSVTQRVTLPGMPSFGESGSGEKEELTRGRWESLL